MLLFLMVNARDRKGERVETTLAEDLKLLAYISTYIHSILSRLR